jgi:hypothetical protein
MKASALLRHSTGTFSSAFAAVLLGLVLPLAASAQTTANALVSGTFSGPAGDSDSVAGTFSCSGSPTCTGRYSATSRISGCTNNLTETDVLTITGLNLVKSGTFQGNMVISGTEWMVTFNANGTCSYQPGSRYTDTYPYTGSWNLSTRTGTMSLSLGPDSLGNPVTLPFTFKAELSAPPPVFPMVVRANISDISATASVDIQFRPQDVGQAGNVYTFAVAPATQVKVGDVAKAMQVGWARGESKADAPVACVLAQLNSSGQLQAATPAQLQAALSGVLSSLGATVPIMNNVPTPNVASATFYVGYGSSGTGMITGGIYRSALTVPGVSICPMVSSQTALWWNPAESGWGLNLNHQGNILFGTLFTYDASGVPLWLVMSNGAMQSDAVTFSGDLYRTTGPAFNANPFTPIGPSNLTRVGTMTVSFIDVNGATLRYTVNGVEVAKAIQRQVFGSRAASCLPSTASRATATNYQDLWWNSAESGWGINVTHQDNILFATLFTYDASGRDLWLVMSAGNRQADGSYSGDLYRTTGPPFNANPFTPIGPGNVTTVGTMRLRFTDGNNGVLTYTYNGAQVTKSITRQLFSSPVPLCN